MLALVFAFLLQSNPPFLHEDAVADKAIRQSMQSSYHLNLAAARKEAQSLQARYPDHPIGYTMFMETYWWEAMTDPGNKQIENAYYKAQSDAVDKAEKALKLKKYPVVEITAALASAHGSYARFQVTQKSAYWSALRAGLKAHGFAEQAHKMDPNNYDLWVGIGAFNYFTGSLPSVLKPFAWLIGVRGDAKLGMEQLRTAVEKARYAQTEARIVYYTALLEDKQYAAAMRMLEELVADYPDNFALYTWITEWHSRQDKFSEGAAYFETLSQNQLRRSSRMAQYALLEKAHLQAANSRPAEAKQTIARIRAIPGTDALLTRKLVTLEKSL